MKVYFIFLVITISCCCLHSQRTKQDILQDYTTLQQITRINSNYEVIIEDERRNLDTNISLESFEILLNDLFATDLAEINFLNNLKTRELTKKRLVVKLEFFNFLESSSKKLIIKALSDVSIRGGDFSSLNVNFNLSAEDFTDIRYKDLYRDKSRNEIRNRILRFSEKFAKKLANEVKEYERNEELYIYKVTSLGSAMGDPGESDTKKKALYDGLINAANIAFGMQIMNRSEIIDYGEVTDIVQSEIGGTIIDYEVEEDSTVFSADGYCIVVVRSLLSKKL